MRKIRRIHVPRPRVTYANVAGTLALVMATTGFAVAAIPSSGGVIRACYKARGGAVRLVDTTRCRRGERAISWSQQGRPGTAGTGAATAGASGPAGPAGPVGPAGPAGPAGREGAAGQNGQNGAAGSIQGAPAGGDLGGTYPNPTLGADVVDTTNVANGSLKAVDVTKASGSVFINATAVPPNSCNATALPFPVPHLDAHDTLIVTPTGDLNNGLVVQPFGIAAPFVDQIGFFRLCNVTAGSIDPPNMVFDYMIFDGE